MKYLQNYAFENKFKRLFLTIKTRNTKHYTFNNCFKARYQKNNSSHFMTYHEYVKLILKVSLDELKITLNLFLTQEN